MSAAHPDEFRVPLGEDARDQEYVNVAVETFELSSRKNTNFRAANQPWYDMVRGYFENDSGSRGVRFNNTPVNFLFGMIQSALAKKQLFLFGERPYCQFIANGQEMQAIAKRRSVLVEGQFDACGGKAETLDGMFNAEVYGTEIKRYYWRRDYGDYWERGRGWLGNARTRKGRHPQTGDYAIKFDGPAIYNIDPLDFFPWPGVKDIRLMRGVCEQMITDFEDVIRGGEDGADGSPPLYDPRLVAKIRYNPEASPLLEGMVQNRLDMAAGAPIDRLADLRTRHSRPCHILEYSGRVPRDMALYDPETRTWCTQVHIIVYNCSKLLAKIPIPFWDRQPPYVKHSPVVDSHNFWAPGKVEIAMRLQAAINKHVSRGLDFLDLYLDPMKLYNSDFIDGDSLFTGPGNLIDCTGTDDVRKALEVIYPDLSGFQVNLQQVAQLWQWMQQVLGMSADISLGAGEVGSDRQSAHEWVGRENAINLRSRLELFKYEEESLIPTFQHFMMMNRQWLTFPFELDMLGSQAMWDSDSQQFVVPESGQRVSLEEMKPELGLRPLNVTRQISQEAKMDRVDRLMPWLGPFLPGLNLRSFLADLLPLYGFHDIERKLNTEENMKLALQYYATSQQPQPGAGAGTNPKTAQPGLSKSKGIF